MRRALRRVANVFVPLIPALIGCGVIAGLGGLLVNLGALPSLTPALTAIASGFMALIAVFVGHNTAQEFGGTPILGGAVAAIVVYAGVARIEVFGQQLSPARAGCWERSPRRSSPRASRSGAAAASPKPSMSSSRPP